MNGIVEKSHLALGIVPLNDSAPLVIAKEKGFFADYGLTVTLSKEPSWANIRDKVASGILDGAHMLAGIPIANSIGIGPVSQSFITGFSLGLNGNAITVSNNLYEQMQQAGSTDTALHSARALKAVIEQRRSNGMEPLRIAHVYEYSSHNYELRYWLAAGGIDPDRDVRLIVIPPVLMVNGLKAGGIDAFCVGEPWNSLAQQEGCGQVAVDCYSIWNNAPEKVFGVTSEWHRKHPNTHLALLKALLQAVEWLDHPDNTAEAASIMQQHGIDGFSTAPRNLDNFMPSERFANHFPWQSHAEWFISQMYRWGQLDFAIDIARTAATIYRPDLYREAAWELGTPAPSEARKTEGLHTGQWEFPATGGHIMMGADLFLDHVQFDPTRIMEYLTGFGIAHLRVDIERLAALNP